MSDALLEIGGFEVRYGKMQALHGVNLRVPRGAIVRDGEVI